jgi:predicted phosphodiesterase
MKIRMMSDLHLEFGNYKVEEVAGDVDSVLVLAGDIHMGLQARNWIERLSERFRAVIYVLGNHEFYKNDYMDVVTRWSEAKMPDNVYVLDEAFGPSMVYVDDVAFVGTTLWTDMNREDIYAMSRAKLSMNDYNVVRYDGRIMTPENTVAIHKKHMEFLEAGLVEAGATSKVVVAVTHHLPTPYVVHPKFKGDILNAAYAANADRLLDFADVWIHGHTHESHDTMCGDCRVICNPRGYYPRDLNPNFNPIKYIEV